MITAPTEMTYKDKLIIKDTCDKIIRCMSQFKNYTKKQLMNDEFLDDYETWEDYKKSTSIPIYSYLNENPMNGLCEVIPTHPNDSYVGGKGSYIAMWHCKDNRTNKVNTSWGYPVGRYARKVNIYNAIYACELFYSHFNTDGVQLLKGEVAQMLLEEYSKEPLFLKEVA